MSVRTEVCSGRVGAERESGESEHEPNSPALVLGHHHASHGRQLSTASASRDSGLTMSNPQLYDDDDDDDDDVAPGSPTDEQRTLERHGPTPGATAAASHGPPPVRKSTTISDDSVLGSPNDFSAENSEQDLDDVTLRRAGRNLGVATAAPLRLRSLESSESASGGLASAFFAQRPKSFDVVQAADLPDDFLPASSVDPVVVVAAEKDGSKNEGFRRTLERTNAVEELTPVNSWRRRQPGTPTDRDMEPLRDRIRQSPSGRRDLPSPAVDPTHRIGEIQRPLSLSSRS